MTKQQTEALKPCPDPWCKFNDPVVELIIRRMGDASPRRVECACGVAGPAKPTDAEAIAAWNTRATPSTAPSDTLETGAEPEEEAWTWLESKWLNIEAGHDPNDRDYSADEMVDAFIAGRDRRLAPAPMADTLERREAIARIIDPVKFAALDRAGIKFGQWVEGSPIERGVRATLAKADAILALSLPAREVSGERAWHIAVLQDVKRRTPAYAGEDFKALRYQECHAAFDAAIAALATTPAPREMGEQTVVGIIERKNATILKLEADLAVVRKCLDDVLATSGARGEYHSLKYSAAVEAAEVTLKRLSEEG